MRVRVLSLRSRERDHHVDESKHGDLTGEFVEDCRGVRGDHLCAKGRGDHDGQNVSVTS